MYVNLLKHLALKLPAVLSGLAVVTRSFLVRASLPVMLKDAAEIEKVLPHKTESFFLSSYLFY